MGTTVKQTHVIARRLAAGCALAAAALGVAGLLGWVLDSSPLRTVLSGYAGMKANTALCLILAGLALFLAAWPGFTIQVAPAIGRALAATVALIGGAVLLQDLAAIDLGIDQLLFRDEVAAGERPPGRMARAAAVGFVMFGLAMHLTFRRPDWSFRAGFAFTACGFWAALFVGVAYMFQVDTLFGSLWFAGVALHTALAFVLLFAGLMLAVPDRGWARIVMTDKFGGYMARRVLPLVAVLPLFILWLTHKGAELGLYPDRLGEYIGAVALLIALTTIALVMSGRLNVLDAHRRTIEEGRQRAHAAAVRLRQIAEMDPLTELSNRRHFQSVAAACIGSAHAQGGPLSMLMVDIDHFKRINDTYGHAAGDQALRLLARTLRESTRRADCVARLGGEEFAILLPEIPPAEAHRIAQRICEMVARIAVLPGDGRRFGFTVSIGLAILGREDAKPEDLLTRADAALYRAKRSGRNRVELADPVARQAA